MSPFRTVRVETEPAYEVRIGTGLLEEIEGRLADHTAVALVADERAAALHLRRLGALAERPTLRLPPGEDAKRFAVLERALEFLAAAGLDRRSALLTFGGGAAGDLGGLAASLYMRGIAVYHAPTTLLAQVDSSVGGKTAINLEAGKNLAGSFHHPRGVWADVETLGTLDESDYASGLGEVLKTALVGGEPELLRLERAAPGLALRSKEELAELVTACVRVKAGVVARDPGETGQRKVLNLGHTFAHAIEHAAGYGRVAHGVAVAVGVALALAYARRAGLLESPELEERVRALLAALGLPTDLRELRRRSGLALAAQELLPAMARDKKSIAGCILLVLPRRPGELAIDVPAQAGLLREVLS